MNTFIVRIVLMSSISVFLEQMTKEIILEFLVKRDVMCRTHAFISASSPNPIKIMTKRSKRCNFKKIKRMGEERPWRQEMIGDMRYESVLGAEKLTDAW